MVKDANGRDDDSGFQILILCGLLVVLVPAVWLTSLGVPLTTAIRGVVGFIVCVFFGGLAWLFLREIAIPLMVFGSLAVFVILFVARETANHNCMSGSTTGGIVGRRGVFDPPGDCSAMWVTEGWVLGLAGFLVLILWAAFL